MSKSLIVGIAIFFILCFAMVSYASVDVVYEVAVINFQGEVQVDPNSDGNWLKPRIGMKLKKESLIKTGTDSFIEVVFDSEGLNVLRIKQKTLITIQNARVDLKNGSVLAAFANLKEGSTFSVKTPTAVCGIRGSGMGVDYIDNMTIVSAYEHSVYVQGLDANGSSVGQEIVIPEGWKVRVLQHGITDPPSDLTDNEMEIFEAWVAFVIDDDDDDNDDDNDENEDNKDLEEKKEVGEEEKKPEISSCGEEYPYSDHNFSME